ncbi:MAG: phenylalanine--tRNA ligase subunit beta [Syntrophomonadaceae bacterium]|jgi:phenylalanyl-tRNA synthetase beta chain
MGVSLKWLKEYVDFDLQAEELAHKLTMAGIAVERVNKLEDDEVLELDLTPNRGDCLGLIHLAREVSALTGAEVQIPKISYRESKEKTEDFISVVIEEPQLCRRYAARLIKNVKIKPSPVWMQELLINSGIRPINNVVDITNYVMLETNQPLHAFDYDLLQPEKRIIVRTAKEGEKIITLDGNERELEPDMLLITDNNRPVALAGIMGGENTEIGDNTVNVLLESASFQRENIRRTSKKVGLRTDSSIRFEKGADVNGVIYAINRAAQLIQQLAGGEITQGIVDVYPHPVPELKVRLRTERVNHLLGTRLKQEEIKAYLTRLSLIFAEEDKHLVINVPSYRPDIEIEVDLIEEIARLHGYDNIPATLPKGDAQGYLTSVQEFTNRIKNIMVQSMTEVINYSFINPVEFELLEIPEKDESRKVITINNPLSVEQSIMRTLLLPGLLRNISKNLARKNDSLAIFEMGSVFYPSSGVLPLERNTLAAGVCGTTELNWIAKPVEMDFFYLKGILENLLGKLGIDVVFKAGRKPAYHPGRTAFIYSREKIIGIIGEIHPRVLENYNIKKRVSAFELDLETLFELWNQNKTVEGVIKYPPVDRDIALLLKEEIPASEVINTITEADTGLLQRVIIYDVFVGEQVPKGYKSMTFKLTFQSKERTLTDEDINSNIDRILLELKNKLGAALR